MKIILALTRDLFFTGKIGAAVRNLGNPPGQWESIIVRDLQSFRDKIASESVDLVLIDLSAKQTLPENLIREAREKGLPVLAFGNHTDPQSLRRARAAGAYRAVPNSLLVQKFDALVSQAFNAEQAPPKDEDEPE